MRAAIVVNPVGGRGMGLRVATEARDALNRSGWETELMPTRQAGDVTRLAHQAAEQGFEVVLACGGDGTFSQVVLGCLDTGRNRERFRACNRPAFRDTKGGSFDRDGKTSPS